MDNAVETLVGWLRWMDWLSTASNDELSAKRSHLLAQQDQGNEEEEAVLKEALKLLEDEASRRL